KNFPAFLSVSADGLVAELVTIRAGPDDSDGGFHGESTKKALFPAERRRRGKGPAKQTALLRAARIRGLGRDRRRLALVGSGLAVNGIEDFLPVDRHFFGSNDAQPDLVAPDFDHRHGDVIVDDNAFVFFPGQY